MNWFRRLTDYFNSDNKNTKRKAAQRKRALRFESLEDRTLLNAAPVLALDSSSYDITSQCPWYIPLSSTDADGDDVYYKVEVTSGSLTADLSVGTAWKNGLSAQQLEAYYQTRNPYWQLTVNQEGNAILTDAQLLFEFFADKAPDTVEHIIGLTNKDVTITGESSSHTEKFYQNTIFHRVISGFMSQAGSTDIYGNNRGSIIDNIADEFNNNLQMNSPGVLAMANTGYKDTGSSQFFITSERCDWLNFKHTVFGFMLEGSDVLAEINRQGTSANSTPATNIVITDASVVENQTHSTLTLRSGAISGTATTATLKITPVDEHGLAGAAQYITVNIASEKQSVVFAPMENDYLSTVKEGTFNYNIDAWYATGQKLGYYAELYHIVYDSSGSNGNFKRLTAPISYNYTTGQISIDTTKLEYKEYYLDLYVFKYDSVNGLTNDNFLTSKRVPLIVYPGVAAAPTGVTLSPTDDTGVVGDGYTESKSGLTFNVDGVDSRYVTVVYTGSSMLGAAQPAQGASSVSVESTTYDSSNKIVPIQFGYGSYDVVAYQVWNQSYYYQNSETDYGWKSANIYSSASPVFNVNVVLPSPKDLQASEIASTSFNLSWTAVEEADSYYLEFRKKGDSQWITGTWSDADNPTTCGLNDLTPGATYEVRISAYQKENVYSCSLPCDIIEVTTLGQLSAPTNVWAELANDEITASWDAVDQTAGYQVQYRALGAAEWVTAVENTAALSATISLEEGTQGVFEIAVFALSGDTTVMSHSYGEMALTDSADLPILTGELTTWSERTTAASVIQTHEWDSLCLKISAQTQLSNADAARIVFQYDASLFTPDWANSELDGVEYSYINQTLDGTMCETTLIIGVIDATKFTDSFVGYIRMIPASQADGNAEQNGVAVLDEKRDFILSCYTDAGKTQADGFSTSVWAVPYDSDDNGAVNLDDFVNFALNFSMTADASVKDMTYVCDYDNSGLVDLDDFVKFALHFNSTWDNCASMDIPKQTAVTAAASQLPKTSSITLCAETVPALTPVTPDAVSTVSYAALPDNALSVGGINQTESDSQEKSIPQDDSDNSQSSVQSAPFATAGVIRPELADKLFGDEQFLAAVSPESLAVSTQAIHADCSSDGSLPTDIR